MKERFYLGIVILAICFGLGFSVGFSDAADPVVIAWPTTLDFPEGYEGRDAAIMATEEINSRGGVDVGGVKRTLKIEPINTRDGLPGVPVNDALMAYKQIVANKHPDLIIGGAYRSEVLLAAMDFVTEQKLVHVSTYAMTPAYDKKVSEDYEKYKYFFRVQMNAIDFAMLYPNALAYLAKTHGLKKAHIVVEDADWAVGTGNFVQKWLAGNNWEVTGYDKFPIGATDYASTLVKIKQNKADVMVYAFSTPQSAILLKQWNAMKVPVLPLGYLGAAIGEKAWTAYQGNLEYVLSLTMGIGHLPVKEWPESGRFYEAFKKRWSKAIESGNCVPNSYDAVYVAADAMNRAGSLESVKLIKALEQTDMKGATGRLRFGKDHKVAYGNDPKETAVGACFQWVAPGKRVPVFPPVIAESEIVLPPWMKK